MCIIWNILIYNKHVVVVQLTDTYISVINTRCVCWMTSLALFIDIISSSPWYIRISINTVKCRTSITAVECSSDWSQNQILLLRRVNHFWKPCAFYRYRIILCLIVHNYTWTMMIIYTAMYIKISPVTQCSLWLIHWGPVTQISVSKLSIIGLVGAKPLSEAMMECC